MLAQNLMTPAALGISDAEFSALLTVLGMLERRELVHCRISLNGPPPTTANAFNLGEWSCGTAACIGGWAERVNGSFADRHTRKNLPYGLNKLFFPDSGGTLNWRQMFAVTPAQAAIALRSYLTTGEPRWAEALSE